VNNNDLAPRIPTAPEFLLEPLRRAALSSVTERIIQKFTTWGVVMRSYRPVSKTVFIGHTHQPEQGPEMDDTVVGAEGGCYHALRRKLPHDPKYANMGGLARSLSLSGVVKKLTGVGDLERMAKEHAMSDYVSYSRIQLGVTVAQPDALPSTEDQHTFLSWAKDYRFDKLKGLLESEPRLLNVQPLTHEGRRRWSALHQAAQSGNTEALTWLLQLGADLTSTTDDGQVPREVAEGDSRVVLDEWEARLSLTAQHHFLDLARSHDWPRVLELAKATPQLINMQPSQRWSVLHHAAAVGDAKVVHCLLGLRADCTLTTRTGQLPLHVASTFDCKTLLRKHTLPTTLAALPFDPEDPEDR